MKDLRAGVFLTSVADVVCPMREELGIELSNLSRLRPGRHSDRDLLDWCPGDQAEYSGLERDVVDVSQVVEGSTVFTSINHIRSA